MAKRKEKIVLKSCSKTELFGVLIAISQNWIYDPAVCLFHVTGTLVKQDGLNKGSSRKKKAAQLWTLSKPP